MPLKPQREGKSLLIGLPAAAAGDACRLQLIYASPPLGPLWMRGTLRVPAVRLLLRADRNAKPTEVPLADLEWKVRLPSGYEATWARGTLTTKNLVKPPPAAVTVAGAICTFAGGVQPFYGAGGFGGAERAVGRQAGRPFRPKCRRPGAARRVVRVLAAGWWPVGSPRAGIAQVHSGGTEDR